MMSSDANHELDNGSITPVSAQQDIIVTRAMTETQDTHDTSPTTAEQMAVGLGIIKDGCKVAVSATEIGFGIAKAATAWGIWIARTAVRGTAAATDFAVPDNPVGGILRAVDTTIDYSNRIAQGSMDAAEGIATTSIRAADVGLGVAGVEDGHLWQLGGGALLGRDAAEAISAIVSMVLHFAKDINIDVLELQRGIRTLSLLQHSAPSPMAPPLAPAQGPLDGGAVGLYMRAAAAAYGSSTLRFFGVVPLTSPQYASEEKFIAKFLDLPSPDHVLKVNLPLVTGKAFSPGYVVFLHHRSRTVVISFRGTTRIQDVLTDLTCQHVDFTFPIPCEGVSKVHEGFLKSARRFAEELYAEVDAALKQHPGYSLVLCGHSLGAGIASLLSMMWQRSFSDGVSVSVHAYAYASPCVVDLRTARDVAPCVTTVVLGNDPVPRFGLGTSEDLRDAVLRLCRDADLSYLQDMSAASEENSQGLANVMQMLRDDVMVHEKLYPPGRVLHIRPGLAEQLVDNGCFSEIVLSVDMFKVHMPGPYLEACNKLSSGNFLRSN